MASDDVLSFHLFCLTNSGTRLDQYAAAIARVVRPGNVVLDLGAGSGVLSFLACRAGARRVYAVEVSDSIALARQLAAAEGLIDRVEFINAPSSQSTLPEPVDVIIADIHDTFGLQQYGLGTFFDARDRFLKPGGVLIPHTVQVGVAAVEAPAEYAKVVDRWRQRVQGIDLSPLRARAVNQQYPGRFEKSQLLSLPADLTRIALGSSNVLHIGGAAEVTATRAGTLHGVCGYFVSMLVDDITIGNTPGDSGTTNFAQAFFPIETPIDVAEGDDISITVDTFDGTGTRWQVDIIRRADGSRTRAEQSTFHGLPLSFDALRRQADEYRPILTERGKMERALLERFDGTYSAAELETWLSEQYGQVVPSRREATALVKSTIDRCG